jgi:hypothetical protein
MFPNFGENAVQPANVSFVPYLAQTENLSLNWPFAFKTSPDVTASLIEISTTVADIEVTMPPANQASVGQICTIRNVGSHDIDIMDNGGTLIATILAQPVDPNENVGNTKQFYVVDNTTAAGVWHFFNLGTGTSSAVADDLAGPGLRAEAGKLETNQLVVAKGADYDVVEADRATVFECTSSLTITLPDPVPNNGFYIDVINVGAGAIVTIDPNGNTINGIAADRVVTQGQDLTLISNGSDWLAEGIQYSQPVPLPIDLGGTNATDATTAYKNITGSSAQGDLIRGGLGGSPQRLALGGAGKPLVSTGTTAAWLGKSIINMVFSENNNFILHTTNATLPDTNITASIITNNSSSKVLVMFDVYISLLADSGGIFPAVTYTLVRNQSGTDTPIYVGQAPTSGTAATGVLNVGIPSGSGTTFNTRITGYFLDSPTTGVTLNYTLFLNSATFLAGQGFALNQKANTNTAIHEMTGSSSMTLIEIGGW